MSGASLVFDIFGRDVSASRELRKVAGEAEMSGGKMSHAFKKAATGISVAGLAAVGESVRMAGNFQSQMTRLVTAAGESEGNLKMVSDGVLKIANDTGTSTDELASGMYMVESAGFHGANGLKVMAAAAQGAKIEGADLGVTGNALTTVMNDIHAPASKAADVMSQMVAAVGQGKMTMDDLAGSIHSVLPNASALGLSLPQVAGALAEMTSQGIGAEQASQNLNHVIVKLAAPTAGMTKTMALYGLTSSDVAKQLGKKGLTGTFEELETAIMRKMGPAGVTLLNSFNESKVAGQSLGIMFKRLPTDIQGTITKFEQGKMPLKDLRKAIGEMSGPSVLLARQWLALYNTSHGFNTALRSGTPAAQTFTAAMKGMLGDQTGLQVALHLTGESATGFTQKVKAIGEAHADSSGKVRDWAIKEKTLNVQIAKMTESVHTAMIEIGTKLIPVVTSAVEWANKHKTAIGFLVVGLVGLAVIVKTVQGVMATARAVQSLWTGATRVATTVAKVFGYESEAAAARAAAATELGAAQSQAAMDATALTAATAASENATAAATFAQAEADKAEAAAVAAVDIAASVEGTGSVLEAGAVTSADAAIEFAAAMQAEADAAVAAAATIEAQVTAAATAAETSAAEVEAAATTAGEASSLSFGPIGLAIAGIAGVAVIAGRSLGIFGSSAHKQVKPTKEFTDAILADNDALGANTVKIVENKLEKDGLYDAGLKLGLSTRVLTQAAMGNSVAQGAVSEAVHEATTAYDQNLAALVDQNSHAARHISLVNLQREAYGKLTPAQRAAYDAALKLNGGMGDVAETLAANKRAADNLSNAQGGLSAMSQVAAGKVHDLNVKINNIRQGKVPNIKVGTRAAADAVAALLRQIALIQDKTVLITLNTKTGTNKTAAGSAGQGAGNNAVGTNNWAGGLTWVGENGPELMSLPAGTAISSHERSLAALSTAGQGGGDVNVYVNGQVYGSTADLGRVVVGALETVAARGTKINIGKAIR